jgi:hypothetical protein
MLSDALFDLSDAIEDNKDSLQSLMIADEDIERYKKWSDYSSIYSENDRQTIDIVHQKIKDAIELKHNDVDDLLIEVKQLAHILSAPPSVSKGN